MNQNTFQVEPIDRGGVSVLSIKYDAGIAAKFNFATARMVAHFKRATTDASPLATIDSDVTPGAMVRTASGDGGYQLDLHLTAAQTAAMTGNFVLFDVLVIDGATRDWLPGIWQWPVTGHITVLP